MDVLLISMPFGPLTSPSIGLSLLKEGLIKKGFKVEIKYFTIDFADLIGAEIYSLISNGYPVNHDMVGEWIFSNLMFDYSSNQQEKFINEIILGNNKNHSKKFLTRKSIDNKFKDSIYSIIDKLPKFIGNCLDEIENINPKIIGFTSVFQQQLASLCLARKIKEKNKDYIVVFGGANNEGIMGIETYSQFHDYVDIVVSGEGDLIFPKIVSSIINDTDINIEKGVINKLNIEKLKKEYVTSWSSPSVRDMDSLPNPCYNDYFEQLREKDIDMKIQPRILFETSRGCWWGMLHHCTFCGLNGDNMEQRTKSPERAMEELLYLHKQYPNSPISVVDNILDYSYFKNFIPKLIQDKPDDLDLFYEVKANLNKDQIRMLKNAGINGIQPGIESLSDEVLKIMKKGVSSIQNIQLLKWCKEIGLESEWNFLFGFPTESSEEYERMANIIPLITHLKPPGSAAPIRLDRFSPNFNNSLNLGFSNVNAYPTYNHIYPFEQNVINNLAYYFTYDYVIPQDVESYTFKLLTQIKIWKEVHENSDLFYIDKQELLLVWDFRPISNQELIILRSVERLVLLICEKAKTIHQIKEKLKNENIHIEDIEFSFLMEKLLKKNLIIFNNIHYLSIVLCLDDEYSPNYNILQKLQNYLSQMSNTNNVTFEIDLNHKEYELH